MRFSVIVPAYNASRYLPECLASIAVQGASDFECVLVDDGSTDGTAQALDSFAAKHPYARVLHGPNGGLLLARRRGLANAMGDYVVFLDADDCLRDGALAAISECLDHTDADIVAFHSSRNSDFSTEDDTTTLDAGLYEGKRYTLVEEHVCRGRFNNMWGKAFRKSCLDLEADYEPYGGLMHGEDLFQILPAIGGSRRLAQMDDVLYYYRPNEGSSTARYKDSQLRDIVTVNRRLRKYASSWGGGCPEASAIGETNSYIYLFKMSELSDAPESAKEAAFDNIRKAMEDEGVFQRSSLARLRPDNRLILGAIRSGRRPLARVLALAAEKVKGQVLATDNRNSFEHAIQRLGFR